MLFSSGVRGEFLADRHYHVSWYSLCRGLLHSGRHGNERQAMAPLVLRLLGIIGDPALSTGVSNFTIQYNRFIMRFTRW